MKTIQKNWSFFMVLSICFSQEVLPLTQRYFHTEDLGYNYSRGTYLIVLADASLESILRDEEYGNFIHFKQTQGYNVVIRDMGFIGGSSNNLRDYLQYYYEQEPAGNMLEYVLLVGDVNGNFPIPSGSIRSYNEDEMDVTDYPYTFYDNDKTNQLFFIGRWSIRSIEDLKKISLRTVQYVKMNNLQNSSYLNNAIVVAGNYSDSEIIPVTPIWTSNWLKDELISMDMAVDTAFYYNADNQQSTSDISAVWDAGVGIINYRGWGDSKGWKYPYFDRENIEELNNGWYLPVVMSFVCNTGDFGNEGVDKCFGETLITAGNSPFNPKGAVAMIGPSDLDTDTKFNNVMCAVMWDELLEGRVPELAPALHTGKQALNKEFKSEQCGNYSCAEFYSHVYGTLGDPSLPVWIGEPANMSTDLANNLITSSHISTIIRDEQTGMPIMDVVGALMYEDTLRSKGLSNEEGLLVIEFENIPHNSTLELYLNKAQYFQKKIILTFNLDVNDDDLVQEINYNIPPIETEHVYIAIDSRSGREDAPIYNWIEISDNLGTNLNLSDDSVIKNKLLGFDFQYYGQSFNNLTVCSNGWASFLPCLNKDGDYSNCNAIPYFVNNSIPHPLGPYGMLAPFFDDLDDNIDSYGGTHEEIPFEVFFWSDDTSAIVQWNKIANGQLDDICIKDDIDSCPRHTFQLILIKSDGGNDKIVFQYKDVSNWKYISGDPSELWYVDDHGSTVGIEAPDKNTGTQYLFNLSDKDSRLLQNELAVKFVPNCDVTSDPLYGYDCNGNCLIETDCRGACGGTAVIDECGVCGGPGAIYDCLNDEGISGCTNIPSGACDCDGNTLDCSDICGGTDISCLSINENLIPKKFLLSSYPNPFNPVVTVSFVIPKTGFASIKVIDIMGRELTNLSNQNYQPGYYSANWDASNYASGVYFITLTAQNTHLTQKVLLLK